VGGTSVKKTVTIFILALLGSSQAFAMTCLKSSAFLKEKAREIPIVAIEQDYASPSMQACMKKFKKKVDLRDKDVRAFRKWRPNKETGPIIYSLMVEGKAANDTLWSVVMDYNVKTHAFLCPDGVVQGAAQCF
jgi:hypothetical protein